MSAESLLSTYTMSASTNQKYSAVDVDFAENNTYQQPQINHSTAGDDSDSEDDAGFSYSNLIQKRKLADVRSCGELYIYLKQNPRTFIAIATFLSSLTTVIILGVFYAIGFHPHSSYFVAGIAGIVSNLYAFCHFRTLLHLRREVNKYTANNQEFRGENDVLRKQVDRLSAAKDELTDTRGRIREAIERQEVCLGKFRALNDNLKATGKESLEVLQNINGMALKMERKWKEQLIQKEKKILSVCFERFEWEDGKDGISQKQFFEFRRTLPLEYQHRLQQAGDWQAIAGDDGILQLGEFRDLMDTVVEDVVNTKHERRMTTLCENELDPNKLQKITQEANRGDL